MGARKRGIVIALLTASLIAGCAGDDGSGDGAEGASAQDGTRFRSEAEQQASRRYIDDATHFSHRARLCAAPEIVRAVGAERIDAIIEDRATEAEAVKVYDAYDGCASRNILVMSLQTRIPDLRIEQSRCFVDAAPGEDASREMFLAGLQGHRLPPVEPDAARQLRQAMEKCFSPEQIEALAG